MFEVFYFVHFMFIWCKADFQQSTIKTWCYIILLMCSCGPALKSFLRFVKCRNSAMSFFSSRSLEFTCHFWVTVNSLPNTTIYVWTSTTQLLTRYRTAWVREGRLQLLAESANRDRGLPVPAWATAPPTPRSLPPWSWRNAIPADTALSLQTRKHIQH